MLSAGASVSAARLRIAEVKRGTLTRDVSVQGKVVAAVSPTLYATAAGTVSLAVHAGDKVQKDRCARRSRQSGAQQQAEQEHSSVDSLELDVERTDIDNRKNQLTSKKILDQAQSTAQTAAREVERNDKGYKAGAMPEINVLRAKDALAKAELNVTHAEQDGQLERDTLRSSSRPSAWRAIGSDCLVAELRARSTQLKVRSPVAGQVGQADRAAKRQRRREQPGARRWSICPRSKSKCRCRKCSRTIWRIGMPAEIIEGERDVQRAKSARSRPKSSTARLPAACASATRSRPACARVSG